MLKSTNKRLIAFLLATMMLISSAPLSVLAVADEFTSNHTDHDHNTETNETLDINDFEETTLLKEVKSQIDAMLDKYLGGRVMTAEDVESAVWDMSDDDLISAWEESEALRVKAEPMTDAEVYFLRLYESTETFGYFYETLCEIFNGELSFYASSGTYEPVTDVTVSVSGASNNSISNGAITVTAKGSGGILGYGASAKTATITIYNEAEVTSTISFDWTASSVNELKIDGTLYSGSSGSFSKVLESGAGFTVTVTTAKNSTTNTLVMSNFSIVAAKNESNVTFSFDSTLGSVTVGGAAVSNGEVVTISKDGAALVATSASGVTFIGWIDCSTNKIVSNAASFTLQPADDMTIKPVFAAKSPWFLINGDCLYEGLTAAMNAVSSIANKTVVLMNNATLPSGNYTIPAGVTLLIPFDADNTLYTTVPGTSECNSDGSYILPTRYRTLTMASGANITVNGAISLSAKQIAGGQVAGAPTGPVSFVHMENGSAITVNSGANLYVWGYITGSGEITVKNGGTIYEDFQVTCWRGGTAMSAMIDNSQKVFPLSQYYIQNVEVPMTFEAGAIENGYMSVNISLVGIQGSAVPFIGPNGMFNITSGTITKDYDEATDRLVITINGEISMKSLSISMKLSLIGTKTINSSKYHLPVNSNITVRVQSGGKITITQDIALLPGSEIIVEKGAECVLGKGNKFYIYDATEWALGKFVYNNANYVPLKYAPGKTMSEWHNASADAHVHVAGSIDASQGYVYVTSSGANITAEDGALLKLTPGSETVAYQATQGGSDGKQISYVEIPIKSVSLVENDTGLGGTYEYIDGAWVKTACAHSYSETITTPAGCETTGVKTFNCPCGDSYTETISATGHTEVIDSAKPATCTESGLSEGKHCEICQKVLVAQTIVEAKGHTPGAEATCENAQTCTVCGNELAPAKGHTPGAEATCENAQTCTVCGDELAPAKGHTPGAEATCENAQTCTVCGDELAPVKSHTPGAEATCEENQTCTVCGNELAPAKGHTPGAEATCENAQTCTVCGDELAPVKSHTPGAEATCENAQTCTVCGDELAPAKGHTPGAEATCENAQTCTVCGDELAPAKGHTPGAEATCEEPQICTICGETLNAADGHVPTIDKAKEPTCTETGLTEGSHCLICNEIIVAQEVVSVKGHTPGVEATCENAQTCTVCGDELAPAKGHTPGAEATCKDNQTCTVCGDELAPAKGHTPGAEATCKDNQTCTVCGDELAPAKGHTPGAEATCENAQTCTVCGDELAAAKGHKEIIDSAVEASCSKTGLTEGSHCEKCEKVFVAQIIVPVKAHTPGTEATCEDAQTCTACGAVIVAALGHDWKEVPKKAPGRNENGYEAYNACEVCGEIDGEIIVIPALGEAEINTYEDFLYNMMLLEEIAGQYVKENPGKNPIALIIKYIRTGVDRYNSGSWGIMAGYEDSDFAKYVKRMEDMVNAEVTDGNYVTVTGLKNIHNFTLPNGDNADIGHVFGAMDITYHNKGSQNHADVSGWAGDLVDLLEVADIAGVTGTLDEMIQYISENLLGERLEVPNAPSMNQEDIDGDLDAYYIMYALYTVESEYSSGTLTEIFLNYFTEELTDEKRAEFFLRNRLETTGTRAQVRDAVYTEYAGNKLIATLEGTRELDAENLFDLRKAVCYSFADYLCRLAGDYVEKNDNPYYTVFNSGVSVLAPGITQEYYQATSVDGKQMIYYVATADITRDDVHIFANYNNASPESGWAMQRVLDQANAAQKKYGDPESPDYIPNYNVIVSTNADGYNMSTGEPGGLLIMDGKEWHGIGAGGFFGITKDGKAIIGTKDEYNNIYRNQLAEAVGGFGTLLIKDGEIAVSKTDSYYTDRAPRTAVGITKTGKVVLMVLDGRQEPYSCGGSMQEIAQIMFEAGCIDAVNLDGGGSTTFVAKQQGEDELAVLNRPSDGAPRSVSTSLLMVSTAPSSTAFDHANLESAYSYSTIGTPVKITPIGISATGNVTDLPEGYTWAVSDNRWATISEDGVFTGLRNGTVEVYLMLDGAIIGSKTMNIVVPESIYFDKKSVDAVYGSTIRLPIAALFEGKAVAINENDIEFKLENTASGTINGFSFTAAENSSVKVVKITASLKSDASITANANINLYKQGENSFDFDKATGGDRLLAWDRVVSNSITNDGMSFIAIDTNEKMVTSYIFAMDMSQIPIPSQLADLVYMLPGADMEDASAWNFLLQLAERISTLTEVTPILQFDPKVNVDYSELKIINDYFELVSTEFDEATNTLKLKLRWIDQTAAIDPATANPICIVSGIKLTPKEDANWDSNKRLNLVHSGQISYKIYLRANALYSFAQKPENQEIFGLMPFVNPDLPSESGAYFSNVYKEFEDTYTLVNALKNGWFAEGNGFSYYVEGVRLSGGVWEINGEYYYFTVDGINDGQTKYTGVFFDDRYGGHFYAKNGILEGGWQFVDGEWYYFDTTTLKAVTGAEKIGGITFEFDGKGKLKSGVWVNVVTGWRYYYGPSYYYSRWYNIDGEWYYFRNGHPVTGYSQVSDKELNYISKWYNFGEDGIARELEYDGFYNFDGELYYIEDGIHKVGLHKIDGDYYFFTYNGPAICGKSYYTWETHCDLPCDTYAFGLDGKMVNGLAEMEDGIYYYTNGKVNWQEAGLHKIGDDYYFINTAGKCVTGTYYAWATFCDLPCSNYEFGPDGKMLRGIVEKEDGYYYYVNGKIDWTIAGLHKIGNDYYFINTAGKCITGPYYAWATFCDLPCGNYEFGPDGKMLQGIVEKEDGYYFYVNGKIDWTKAGLHKIGDDYYFVNTAGKCVTGPYYAWATFCDLPCGNYEFGSDGKMLHGFVEREDGIYCYVNGKLGSANPGLAKIDGYYYFINSKGQCVTGTYYAWATNCDLPVGTYEFDEQGRMYDGFVTKADGIYYYENGKLGKVGVNYIDGHYYFINSAGKLVTNQVFWVWETNGLILEASYLFNELGQIVRLA